MKDTKVMTYIVWPVLIGVCVEKYSKSSEIVFATKNWAYDSNNSTIQLVDSTVI